MKNIKGSGNYINKADNSTVDFSFDYPIYEDISEVDDTTLLALANRMAKLDCRNKASLKAQATNGHNARTMSEEDKAEAKAKRKANQAILDAIKAKGLSLEDIDAI